MDQGGEQYSSSNDEEYDSESSDDFPSPNTPQRRRRKDRGVVRREESYGELFDRVKDMSRRLCEMEIENRKLKVRKEASRRARH